jgi:glycerophosphoryl diester phosphodiesterase
LGPHADNSLSALLASKRASIPLVEVDVRRSIQGELFLFHDGSLTSDNSFSPPSLRNILIGKLSKLERASIALDSSQTIRIPTLQEALSVLKGSNTALQVDMKGESDELVTAVADTVAAHGMLSQVVFQIREVKRIALVKQRYPSARILARCVSSQQLAAALEQGVEFVELERWATSEAISQAHSHRAKVLINLAGSRLDEPQTWRYLRSRGVDVLMSDRASEHVRDCNQAKTESLCR